MSDESQSSWKLDLDAAQALEDSSKFAKNLDAAAGTDFSTLISHIGQITTIVGAVGLAVLAVKEAFDLVLDAEKVEAVNQQFDVLARNAGLVGEDLKAALEKSSGGLVDEISLLKGASGAVVELGANAARLPELMTLARNATAVFGGDLIQNFNSMAQAVASGNARMLRHLGIVVDQQKAYRDYANSIGVAVDELSQAGRATAVMNAALEAGKTAFNGVDLDVQKTTNSWKQFKAAMGDFYDSIALVVNYVLGGVVGKAVGILRDMAVSAKHMMTSFFGSDAEKARVNIQALTDQTAGWRKEIARLQELQSKDVRFQSAEKQKELNAAIADYQKKIDGAQAKIKQLAVTEEQGANRAIAASKNVAQESSIDTEKRRENLLKFQTDLDKLRSQNEAAEAKSATSVEAVDKALAARKVAVAKETADAIAKVDAQLGLSRDQKARMREQLERQQALKLKEIDQSLNQERIRALTNLENENAGIAQKVANTWKAESQKAKLDMLDFSKVAKASFDAVQSRSVSAFEAMGEGSQSAGDAMKGAMFGTLGDIAEAQGKLMLGAGLFPLDPVVLAGGAALLVLAGFLKGQAKGGISASSGGASGSPSGGGGSSGASTAAVQNNQSSAGPSTGTQAAKQGVTLVVQGHMMLTDQTQQWLVSQIRAAADATDFKVQSVGGGL